MQSQLEAALLGHGVGTNHAHVEEEDREEQFDETEDADECIDEVLTDSKLHASGIKHLRPRPELAFKIITSILHLINDCDAGKINPNTAPSRNVTLQMLLSARVLQPGKGTMSIEYLGQRFVGDLLEDGKIRSQETDIVFASPSAWAIACKRFINPVKKSGCGWASIRYKGRKLDAYKSLWYKKRKDAINKLHREEQLEAEEIMMEEHKSSSLLLSQYIPRLVVKHNTIANRTFTHDANTLIECVPFSNLGKIQPFMLSLSTNAALLMDFHCHLTRSEVSGYLAGHWDVNSHSLHITHAFPCRNTKADRENGPQVELEISKAIERQKLLLVGWYHSHPFTAAAPTLRDIDAQLDYQIRMKGLSDSSYTPCVGIIISPYNYENPSLESSIIAYWVIPPPENKPNEYGRPMLMSYSVVQDPVMTPNIKEEITKCVDYYKKQSEILNFTDKYLSTTSFIEKLKSTLISKFPQDHNDPSLWSFIRDSVGCPVDEDSLLTIPTVTKSSQMLPTLNTPVSLNSNLMLTSDIASVLFNSGKFPSASSLLGLPDPMAHSTLAANNMFLSTNLFKMQDLLKPVSTSSPIPPSKAKSETKTSASTSTPLKIPTDIKKIDFSDLNLLSYKNKLEYAGADLNLSSVLDTSKKSKSDFSASDLSISSNLGDKRDYSDLSRKEFSVSDLMQSSSDYSLDLSRRDEGEKSSKIPKSDYSLDLSNFSIKNLSEYTNMAKNLVAMSTASAQQGGDQPMNLTSN